MSSVVCDEEREVKRREEKLEEERKKLKRINILKRNGNLFGKQCLFV
jgi:hypothetical protein